ncbi:MAG: hypothetical protein JWP52_1995 [Rhizobacter sp.]|nr:hypothetical protein [Rhizobacter sp.]
MAKDVVVNSVNNDSGDRCVDILVSADGRFNYKEFRRDPEDQGAWFLTAFDEDSAYGCYEDALEAAVSRVVWLGEAIKRAGPSARG